MTMPVQRPALCAAALALLLGAAACTAAARGASWDPVPAGMQSAVRLTVSAPAGVAPRVSAVLVDASGGRQVGRGDFRSTAMQPAPHSAWYPAAQSGTLEVRVTMEDDGGQAVGAGAVSLPLEAGWLWNVEALVHRPAAGIPAPPCSNCDVVSRVPLRPSASAGTAAGDSLFLRAARSPAAGRPPLPPS
jgi:hypothetical protein